MPPIHRLSEDSRRHNDKDPNLARAPDGTLWVTWQSYRMKEDRILARSIRNGRRGPIIEVSDRPGINFQPRIACDADSRVWVFWSAERGDRWYILARRVEGTRCGPVVTVSRGSDLALSPAISADGTGVIRVAWSSLEAGERRILGRRLEAGAWSDIQVLSRGAGEHLRPTLCAREAGAWLAYESRSGSRYRVRLCAWTDRGAGRAVDLNLTQSWEMFPRLCPDGADGVWATWIATHDVGNVKGFIDHKVEALAAHYNGKTLSPYRGPDRSKPEGYVTHLYDGLLGRDWYMGFVGWRRRPQIVRDSEGDVWVLYERKDDERINRHGPDSLFYARPLTGKGRNRSYSVDACSHACTVSGDLPVIDGGLPFAGQISEGRHYADICAGTLVLDRSRPVKERPASDWRQWHPVVLPGARVSSRRPTMRVGGKTYKLYWGDPHCHGNLSGDAEGEIDENYTYGRLKSRLDFMAVSDNDVIYDNVLTPSEWAFIRKEAEHHNRPGRFVAISAYERTCPENEAGRVDVGKPTLGGPRGSQNHRIVLFPENEGPLYHFTEPDTNTPGKWVSAINQTDAFIFPHHATWRAMPGERFGGAEVCSCWDIYIQMRDTIPGHLRQGHRFALMGNSDSHRIVPGSGGALTGVWAEELTREAIFDALRAGRCFATNGDRIALDLKINGAPMGAEVDCGPEVTVSCKVSAPRPIVGITLFRDGERVRQAGFTGRNQRGNLRHELVDNPGHGSHFYYAEVQLKPMLRKPMGARCGNLQVARGDFAWSSPIWVNVRAES
jgi:hypothetical protein